MITNWSKRFCGQRAESGQSVIIIVIILAVFLLGALGLATDYTQIWAKRQTAQAAADAACQAGASDLWLQFENPNAPTAFPAVSFSWIGTDFDCSTNTSSPPCLYAAANGYSGDKVSVSFPSSGSGTCPPLASSFGTIAHPCMKVTVTDPVQMSFARILTHTGHVNTGASAACGLSPVAVPVPLVILHQSASGAFNQAGGGAVTILGGPNRSIQVDSSSTSAVTAGGSGGVDLSQAGPSGQGADFGVFGQETKPGNINLGTNGKWVSPGGPFGDPWVTVAEPTSAPAAKGGATPVPYGKNGCPDPIGCAEFTAGNYSASCLTGNGNAYKSTTTPLNMCLIFPVQIVLNDRTKNHDYLTLNEVIRPTDNNLGNYAFKVTSTGRSVNTNDSSFPQAPAVPSGPSWPQALGATQTDGTLTWTNIGVFPIPTSGQKNTLNFSTAIFDPGLYYMGAEGLQLGSNTTVRQSTAIGDDNKGTTFFFSSNPGSGSNHGTINVTSSTGGVVGCTVANYPNCIVSYKPGGSSQTFGGVTVASTPMKCPGGTAIPLQVPATVDGNILFGPCSGTYGSSGGTDRGFLFFQKRSTAVSAKWSGSGAFLLSGFMYFHNTGYASTLEMGGGSAGGSYTLGNIVTDQIKISGGSALKMILNPAATFEILRPQLLR